MVHEKIERKRERYIEICRGIEGRKDGAIGKECTVENRWKERQPVKRIRRRRKRQKKGMGGMTEIPVEGMCKKR